MGRMETRKRQAEEWKRGACYTFKGARRVWWSFLDAKKHSEGRHVIRFDTEMDAKQWLFASAYN